MDTSSVILIAVVVAIIIIGVVLKKKSDFSVSYPDVSAMPQETEKLSYEPWEGEYDGIKYAVENLGDTPEGEHLITIWMHLAEPLDISIEVNARDNAADISNLPFSSDIKALLDMGVSYIDINYSTNWIAAEVPESVAAVNRAFAERVMKHLAHIYKNAEREKGGSRAGYLKSPRFVTLNLFQGQHDKKGMNSSCFRGRLGFASLSF